MSKQQSELRMSALQTAEFVSFSFIKVYRDLIDSEVKKADNGSYEKKKDVSFEMRKECAG